ncbi:hydrogenase maturation nickel metallochaperone HypA [Anoxybacter fermentans]|uniref:Hydrogenase maturation factor HypA n=1 Tax=Anoxybacter fermentans TaxID=1323375 RepID=A0A3S9SXK2_9FIRM|nr:hydrogenase maturation nickel metallochaperone HypA [Anoxybacter fermentans]AZR72944.1 hydrogenase maturation nickel metallochaperone HypA [Anoxybacter fermentans]
MHELSLMQSIFEIVEAEMKAHGLAHIDLVKIKVGELTAVEGASMQFAFEVLKKGTGLENARLEIEYVPGVAYCAKCDLRYLMEGYRIICPQCGRGGRIIAGKELYVDSLGVDDGEENKNCQKCIKGQ